VSEITPVLVRYGNLMKKSNTTVNKQATSLSFTELLLVSR